MRRVGIRMHPWGLGLLLLAARPVQASVLHVNADATGTDTGASWTDAFTDLQDALAAARAGDRIWVAAGTYTPAPPGGSRDATFQLQTGVRLYGGFAGTEANRDERDPDVNITTLSGDLAGDDGPDFTNIEENSHCVVAISGTDATAVLDGFTITGGSALEGEARGGGLRLIDASPTIINCTIRGNRARVAGAGVYNQGGSPTLIDCTFAENWVTSRGGGLYTESGSPVVRGCRFIRNRAHAASGGGAYNQGGHPSYSRCTFTRNSSGSGGGMVNMESSTAVDRCTFDGNSASFLGGGMLNWSSDVLVTNCVFRGNRASQGGAISNSGGRVAVTNSTLSGNAVYISGGGIFNYQRASLRLTNCILWANRDPDGQIESAQITSDDVYSVNTIVVNHCCIQGLTGALGGVGNIDARPLFVRTPYDGSAEWGVGDNADFGDVHLMTGSPCLNAGDDSAVPPSARLDLDDNARIANGRVDMGAFEGPRQGILTDTDAVAVLEGTVFPLAVSLGSDPRATVTVSVVRAEGDDDVRVDDGAMLTFDSTNFSTPQVVTLAVVDDDDQINGQATIRIHADGIPFQRVIVSEIENDVPPILLVDAGANGANNGTSWTNAFTDLQGALRLAREFPTVEEIWVAAGTYTPDGGSGDRGGTFSLLDGVGLYGGFASGQTRRNERDPAANPTILSGDLNSDDGPGFANIDENSMHVVTAVFTDSTTVLDGFVVVAGNANRPGRGRVCIDRQGGGLFIRYGNPTIRNCTFLRNSVVAFGGALSTEAANPTLQNCFFGGNTALNGGGIYIGRGSPIISNCVFSANSATASGGGLFNVEGQPWFLNCTFSANVGSDSGGGVWSGVGTDLTLNNCILWGNEAPIGPELLVVDSPDYRNDPPAGLTVNFSAVRGGQNGVEVGGTANLVWGTGNIDADPRFVDVDGADDVLGTADDNLELQPGSPCINAGDPSFVAQEDEKDSRGNPRVQGRRVDMGAFETPWAQGDADFDSDVDLADFLAFAKCFGGAGEPAPDDCRAFDLDGDGDVDLADLLILQAILTGAL